MSWEEDYRHERPCFCGKGKIVSWSRSDDWNRSESGEYLECEDCQRTHVYAYVDPYRAARMKSDGYRWMTREAYAKFLEDRDTEVQKRRQAWKDKLDAIAPPHMGMKQKEIVALIESTFPNVSFNRSASKSKLIDEYEHWRVYYTEKESWY